MLDLNLKLYSAVYTVKTFTDTNEVYDYVIAYNEDDVKNAIYAKCPRFKKIIGDIEITEIQTDKSIIL